MNRIQWIIIIVIVLLNLIFLISAAIEIKSAKDFCKENNEDLKISFLKKDPYSCNNQTIIRTERGWMYKEIYDFLFNRK